MGGWPTALRFAIVLVAIGLFAILAGVAAAVSTAFVVYESFARELPSPEEIQRRSVETFETTRLYDRTGQHVLYEFMPQEDMSGGKRTWVPLARIPEYLRNATIAVEDKTFYTNPGGINIEGVTRAAWGVIRGQYAGGGSSIYQQLVRNVIMSPEERMEPSYERKIKEMILSIELTRRYPGIEGRNKILEWYLNNIFYGRHAYGVEAAAQAYFGKHVEELSLAESAMLVPLGNLPTLLWRGYGLRYASEQDAELKRRQELVLEQMYRQGYITAEEAERAKQEAVVIVPEGGALIAPHFVIYVRDELEKKYGKEAVYSGGLQVITSIDLDIQAKAQEIARQHIAKIRAERNAHNAAVVVLDPKTAEILAMVGSLDYEDDSIDGQVNMATSPRQPGSSFKPFVYATAFAQGYTPATMIMDVRTSFPDPPSAVPYVPENYSRTFHGPILLRRALGSSLNIPAVAMAHKVGTDKIVRTARAMGITTLTEAGYGLSLALGGYGVTLLDMTYAFSVFANGGTMLGEPIPAEQLRPGYRRLNPVSVLRVSDARGNALYEYRGPQRQEVIRPEVAFLINDILSDNNARAPAFGPNSYLVLEDRPAAAKTGTTDDFIDGWTVGYTPQYVVGVWVGNANAEPMIKAPGVRAAGPIWQTLMKELHKGLPVEGFPRPAGIETAVVDGTSGKLPTEYSPWRMQEVFIKGTVPTEPDDVHRPYRICKQSGKLATVYCPAQDVETVVFEIYPPEADDWVREQGIPQPPKEHCDLHGPNLARADVAIIRPRLFEIVRGVVPIIGNAKPGGLQRFQVEFGDGMEPPLWYPIGPEHGHRVDNGVLEQWDTQGLDGLYTLRLSVMVGGNWQRASVPIIVDNISPTVSILEPSSKCPDLHPPPGQPYRGCQSPLQDPVYVLNQDEWISIQVQAEDNTSMEGVEFFMDAHPLGVSTVAPYTLRWTLAMSDIVPSYSFAPPPPPQMIGDTLVRTDVITAGENRIYTHTIERGGAVTMTQVIESPAGLSYYMTWPSGRAIISDTLGYTETHVLHVVAYDTAGNQRESDPVTVHVIHKREKE